MICLPRQLALLVLLVANVLLPEAYARVPLKNICRVKGQEESTLSGLGLVVGLKGTGDAGDKLPTLRALANAMEIMGHPLSRADGRKGGLLELKDAKNVALVMVTATVPATGARSGDKLDCSVSAISAKSLAGGRLVFAALQGPNTKDPRVYALAEGRVELDSPEHPLEGAVHGGARMVEDVFNAFHKNGKVTLVLDKNHADFHVASAVAQAINTQLGYQGTKGNTRDAALANAIDPMNIEVEIPAAYAEYPVQFVAEVMELPMFDLQTEARVVINERAGSIVISGDVEIGSVVVTHRNIVVETGPGAEGAKFIPVDPNNASGPKLKSLVESLNAVNVPNADIIEIVKGIERNGKLHGQLIIE